PPRSAEGEQQVQHHLVGAVRGPDVLCGQTGGSGLGAQVVGQVGAQVEELAVRIPVQGAAGRAHGGGDVLGHLSRWRVGVLVDVQRVRHVQLGGTVGLLADQVGAQRQAGGTAFRHGASVGGAGRVLFYAGRIWTPCGTWLNQASGPPPGSPGPTPGPPRVAAWPRSASCTAPSPTSCRRSPRRSTPAHRSWCCCRSTRGCSVLHRCGWSRCRGPARSSRTCTGPSRRRPSPRSPGCTWTRRGGCTTEP